MSDKSDTSLEVSGEKERAVAVYSVPVRQYQFEPLADTESNTDEDDLGHDHDGLNPAVLRERYKQNIEVSLL